MPRKSSQNLTKKETQELLSQQTVVILGAVDDKLKKMELRINQRIDKLTNTIDKFLKKLTDLEDEFTLLKAELRKVKAVLKEKLGVSLD